MIKKILLSVLIFTVVLFSVNSFAGTVVYFSDANNTTIIPTRLLVLDQPDLYYHDFTGEGFINEVAQIKDGGFIHKVKFEKESR